MGTGVTDRGLGEGCGSEVPGRVPKPTLPRTWMHWNPCVQKPAGDAASREQLAGLEGMRVTSWGALLLGEVPVTMRPGSQSQSLHQPIRSKLCAGLRPDQRPCPAVLNTCHFPRPGLLNNTRKSQSNRGQLRGVAVGLASIALWLNAQLGSPQVWL